MRTGVRAGLAAFALAGTAGTAQAAWFRAETSHFIVYQDGTAADTRKLASDLERFDGFIRLFHSREDTPGAASNKITVYVLSNVGDLQDLCGGCAGVYGWYDGRASGSVAFTPKRTDNLGSATLKPQQVLFHEYAHHFLLGNFALAYPAWFSEGYAEFVSTMTMTDEKVTIGVAANHRAYSLFDGTPVPARLLFDRPKHGMLNYGQFISMYARGWLLTHWIMFDKDRRARLRRYVDALNGGTPSLKAATDAFGDLDALDKVLDRYMRQSTLPGLILKPSAVPAPTVAVTEVTPGVQAMMKYRLASTRGVDAKTAQKVYRRALDAAARFPDDPVAQGWFAEIAFDAGERAAADAAADRALATDPHSAQALLYKAQVAMAAAEKDEAKWRAARSLIVRANRLDPDYAYPLVLFYTSFEREGRPPVKSAIDGLHRALELVPQDDNVRVLAVRQLIRDGRLAEARRTLAPLAYSPHGAEDSPAAKAMAALDAGDAVGALASFEPEKEEAKAPAGKKE